MKTMRTAMILLAVGPLTAIDARPSGAETYRPWCVQYSGRGGDPMRRRDHGEGTLDLRAGGERIGIDVGKTRQDVLAGLLSMQAMANA